MPFQAMPVQASPLQVTRLQAIPLQVWPLQAILLQVKDSIGNKIFVIRVATCMQSRIRRVLKNTMQMQQSN